MHVRRSHSPSTSASRPARVPALWALRFGLLAGGVSLAAVSTSGCATAALKAPSKGHLVEANVNGGELTRVFRQAFLETEAINEQAVRVNLDGIRYQVLAEPKRKLLVYLTHFRFRPSVDAANRLAFVNDLNSRFIYTRFSVDKDGDLACEYFLSFKGGIDENQVVDALQWMTNTTVQSIKQADTGNLVQ